MKFALALATLAAVAFAAPIESVVGAQGCEYNAFESFNLLHGHDINTGKIKLGSVIIPSGIAIGGTCCSPRWAVGGSIDDSTPTKSC